MYLDEMYRVKAERDENREMLEEYRISHLTVLFANVNNDWKKNPRGYKPGDFFPLLAKAASAGRRDRLVLNEDDGEDAEAEKIAAAKRLFATTQMWARELGIPLKAEPVVNGN